MEPCLPYFEQIGITKKPLININHGLEEFLGSPTWQSRRLGTGGFRSHNYSSFGFIGKLNQEFLCPAIRASNLNAMED
jgi:hypothetical protein